MGQLYATTPTSLETSSEYDLSSVPHKLMHEVCALPLDSSFLRFSWSVQRATPDDWEARIAGGLSDTTMARSITRTLATTPTWVTGPLEIRFYGPTVAGSMRMELLRATAMGTVSFWQPSRPTGATVTTPSSLPTVA